MRKWETMLGEPSVSDLKIVRYQTAQQKGNSYQSARLSVGVNRAQKIMTLVLVKVLSMNQEINEATDHHTDDIIVNIVWLGWIEWWLICCSAPECIKEALLLGLLCNWRKESLDDANLQQMLLTCRELFSTCGKLVGHWWVTTQ